MQTKTFSAKNQRNLTILSIHAVTNQKTRKQKGWEGKRIRITSEINYQISPKWYILPKLDLKKLSTHINTRFTCITKRNKKIFLKVSIFNMLMLYILYLIKTFLLSTLNIYFSLLRYIYDIKARQYGGEWTLLFKEAIQLLQTSSLTWSYTS